MIMIINPFGQLGHQAATFPQRFSNVPSTTTADDDEKSPFGQLGLWAPSSGVRDVLLGSAAFRQAE